MSNKQSQKNPLAPESAKKEYVVLKAITFGQMHGRKVIAPSATKKPAIVELAPNSSEAKRFLERKAVQLLSEFKKAAVGEDSESAEAATG